MGKTFKDKFRRWKANRRARKDHKRLAIEVNDRALRLISMSSGIKQQGE